MADLVSLFFKSIGEGFVEDTNMRSKIDELLAENQELKIKLAHETQSKESAMKAFQEAEKSVDSVKAHVLEVNKHTDEVSRLIDDYKKENAMLTEQLKYTKKENELQCAEQDIFIKKANAILEMANKEITELTMKLFHVKKDNEQLQAEHKGMIREMENAKVIYEANERKIGELMHELAEKTKIPSFKEQIEQIEKQRIAIRKYTYSVEQFYENTIDNLMTKLDHTETVAICHYGRVQDLASCVHDLHYENDIFRSQRRDYQNEVHVEQVKSSESEFMFKWMKDKYEKVRGELDAVKRELIEYNKADSEMLKQFM